MTVRRIAIVGAGDIGATLGGKWIAAGHRVVFGVRDPQSATVSALRARLGDGVAVTGIADAVAGSDVVLLAVTGSAAEKVIADNADGLAGRIVIDATNQLVKGKTEADGAWGERTTMNSVATIHRHVPSATVYRAFNTYGWEIFENSTFGDRRADLFYCGPDGAERAVVEQLIDDVGPRPVRLGGDEQLDTLDNVLALWAALALFQGKGRNTIAFAVVER